MADKFKTAEIAEGLTLKVPVLEVAKCDYCGADTVDGVCVDVMKRLFDRLAPSDWKAPIEAEVELELAREAAAAIRFYTATEASFGEPYKVGGVSFVKVTAAGYRAGPAGP